MQSPTSEHETYVELVMNEHPAAIRRTQAWGYERMRRLFAQLAGVPVRSRGYVEVDRFDDPAALILSGSFAPWSHHDQAALRRLERGLSGYGGPVLGICAGMQLQVMFAGGAIAPRRDPVVGFRRIEAPAQTDLLRGMNPTATVYAHHSEDVVALPSNARVLARSERCAVEALRLTDRRWWGTQFHPEIFTTRRPDGRRVLENFFALAGLARHPSDSAHGFSLDSVQAPGLESLPVC
ncbi:MAG: gamma-glutamyl-gamma-aminobutyrate hydrolase family protein [Solirubrobacterales bacterium]|nr:gamma-glutamyl-gamma-aminobutyrate hydrolase family protein [Solirubrobacterales bacterium]